MKIGRTSVKARGSSNRNGLLTGEMKPSKQWSLWERFRPQPCRDPSQLVQPPQHKPAQPAGSAGADGVRMSTPGGGTGCTGATPGGGGSAACILTTGPRETWG